MMKRITIFITVTAMILGFAACSGNSAATEDAAYPDEETAADPVIVQEGGNIKLLCADRQVTLCSADKLAENDQGETVLSGMVSSDLSCLYYMTGYDSVAGTGTLMGAGTDAKSPPVSVSDGVYSAKVSSDGKVFFIKNFKDGAGDLYLYDKAGAPEIKAKSVVDIYGISPDGGSFYYAVKDGSDYIIYADIKGNAQKIFRSPAKSFRNCVISLNDDGDILCGASYLAENMTLNIYSKGKRSKVATGVYKVATGVYIEAIFDSLDIFYRLFTEESYLTSPRSVYCKEIGKDAVCISEEGCWFQFTDKKNGVHSGRSVLLIEKEYKDKVLLYEYTVGRDKTFIGEADEYGNIARRANKESEIFEINKQFTAVSYELDRALYIALKKDGAWVSRKLAEGAVQYYFDKRGRNFYWLDRELDLYKMDITDGKTNKLKSGVLWPFMAEGDEVYYTDSNGTYRLSSGAALCGESHFMAATQGGVYIREMNGNYLYFAEGSDKGIPVVTGGEEVLLSGSMDLSYISPEDRETLKNLAEDAVYYLDKYGVDVSVDVISSPHGSLGEDVEYADSLLPWSVPSDKEKIARFFSEGFRMLGKWADNHNNADALLAGESMLKIAVSLYGAQ